MYIIFNSDGSIKIKNLDEFIQKGNDNVNKIFVAFAGKSNSDFVLSGRAVLPDDSEVAFTGSAYAMTIDGSYYSGYNISISGLMTIYEGTLKVSFSLIDTNNNLLVSSLVKLVINPSTYDEDTNIEINVADLNTFLTSLASYQIKYALANVRYYATLTNANNDITNLAVGQVALVKENGNISFYTKASENDVALTLVQPNLPSIVVTTNNFVSLLTSNLKTINGNSLVGSGNIVVAGGSNSYVSASFVVSGDTAELQFTKGDGTTDPVSIPLCDGTNAGLMSPNDFNAISQLQNDVATLKGQTVRLLYTSKPNPTSLEILAFVESEGYTDRTKYPSIAVVVANTYHIWHWYNGKQYVKGTFTWDDNPTNISYSPQSATDDVDFESNSTNYNKLEYYGYQAGGDADFYIKYGNTLAYRVGTIDNTGWYDNAYKTIDFGNDEILIDSQLVSLMSDNGTFSDTPSLEGYFKDDGTDTSAPFTNTTAGVILGSLLDGQVFAENNGTGSVKGWNKLIANFAPLYDATAQYTRGDIRIYSTDLYVCTTDITTPEAFNSAHWTQIDLDTLLGTTFKGQIKFDTGTGRDTIIEGTQYGLFISNNGVRIFGMESDAIFPTLTNTRDLGRQTLQFKDLYLQGNIKDDVSGASIPPSKITNADAIAQPYDNTATYAVGDLCMHNGQLYECNTPISTPEDFDVSHWTAVNVMGKMPSVSATSPSDSNDWLNGININGTTYKVREIDKSTNTANMARGAKIGYYLNTYANSGYKCVYSFNNSIAGGVAGGISFALHTNKDFEIWYHYNGTMNPIINKMSNPWIGDMTYTLNERLNGLTITDNTITELNFNKITKLSLSSDTTLTLKTAPTSTGTNLSCIPEYKALITNSDNANAITITLTGVNKVLNQLTNTITSGSTITIGVGESIELTIFNSNAKYINWGA